MVARTTHLSFQPGTTEAALDLITRVMLPSASEQAGFVEALVLRVPGQERALVISLWESDETMLASAPPPDVAAELAPLDALIATATQELGVLVARVAPA